MRLFGYELSWSRAPKERIVVPGQTPVSAWLAGETYGAGAMTNAYTQAVLTI